MLFTTTKRKSCTKAVFAANIAYAIRYDIIVCSLGKALALIMKKFLTNYTVQAVVITAIFT